MRTLLNNLKNDFSFSSQFKRNYLPKFFL